MFAIRSVMVFAAAFILSACGPLSQVQWPKLVQCVSGVSDLVGTVSRILLSDGTEPSMGRRARDELSTLAATHGADTIACLIRRLVDDWRSPGAAADPTRAAAADRGDAFLAEVGTAAQLASDQ